MNELDNYFFIYFCLMYINCNWENKTVKRVVNYKYNPEFKYCKTRDISRLSCTPCLLRTDPLSGRTQFLYSGVRVSTLKALHQELEGERWAVEHV